MATAAGRNFVARCRISLLAKPMVSPLQQDMLRARTSALGGSLLRSRCFSSYYGAVAAATEPLRLNNLSPNPRSTKDRKRVGRGNGSGTGKTCGKGHKGSKARKGGKGPRFEGGQTPMHRRIPKRGFKNGADESFETVSVDKIGMYIAMGRLRPKEGLITMKDLQDSGVVQDIKFGVSLVAGKKPNSTPNHRRAILAGLAGQVAGQDLVGGRGDARRARAALPGAAAAGEGVRPLPAIHVEVSRASAAAIEYVESSGGTVTCTHFNRLALRALLKPHKFEQLPMRARPPPKLMPYYLDYGRRGYLSPEVQLRNLQLFGAPTSEARPEMPEISTANEM